MDPQKSSRNKRLLWILSLILIGIFGAIGGPIELFDENAAKEWDEQGKNN